MEAGDPPFYWQPPTTVLYRRRRPPSSPLFDSSLAIILLLCLGFVLLFFAVHSFNQKSHYNPPYYPNQIPNPIPHPKPIFSFRWSWDSLNVVLIVAGILCGIFARRKEDIPVRPETLPGNQNANFVVLQNNGSYGYRKQNQFHVPTFQQQQLQQQQWFRFADNQRIYGFSPPDIGAVWLRRSSSSYSDFMRQEASLREETVSPNRQLFEDFDSEMFNRSPDTNCARHRKEEVAAASNEEGTGAEIEIKEIPVDTFVLQSTEDTSVSASSPNAPPPMSTTPPPPSPPSVSRTKPKRIYQSVQRKEKVKKSAPPPPPAPLPRPSLPPTSPAPLKQVEKKLKFRKSNATKEIASALASLYSHGKRKRKQKANEQDPHDSAERATQYRSPPPSAPPPSAFHHFSRTSSKHKKIHSLSSVPPPPPVAPSSRSSKHKSQILAKPTSQPPPEPLISDPPPSPRTTTSTFAARKPPLPSHSTTYYIRDENSSQSPQTPIPPSPPPPFIIPETKLSVIRDGGFVRTQIAQTSLVGTPKPEDEVDVTTTANEDASRASDEAEMDGGDERGPNAAFRCPSPDVNAKADTFIARHHDGWRLEKLNSWREKRGKNVGPGPSL